MSELEQIKPLDDSDIENERYRLAKLPKKKIDEITNIFKQYKSQILGLINMLQKTVKDEEDIVEVERLKRLVNMCDDLEIFMRTKDKIYKSKTFILNKDAAWFINKKYDHLIKKDHNQAFIETLVSLIKDHYTAMREEEKNLYWSKAHMLIQAIEKYNTILQS